MDGNCFGWTSFLGPAPQPRIFDLLRNSGVWGERRGRDAAAELLLSWVDMLTGSEPSMGRMSAAVYMAPCLPRIQIWVLFPSLWLHHVDQLPRFRVHDHLRAVTGFIVPTKQLISLASC